MNHLYVWDSKCFRDAFPGTICVIAASVEEARAKVWAFVDATVFASSLGMYDAESRRTLGADLACEPRIADAGVEIIEGSA